MAVKAKNVIVVGLSPASAKAARALQDSCIESRIMPDERKSEMHKLEQKQVKDERFDRFMPALPEKQTYIPKLNRKSKRW